jgi:opacity protein-like surface antigen
MGRARIALALVAFGVCQLAAVARALPPPEEKNWEIALSAYGWLVSVYSEVEVGDVHTDVDVKFRDLLSDLGWGVMGGVEGRYERALLDVDFLGVQLVSDVSQSPRQRGFALPNGTPGLLTVGGIDAHTRLTIWMLDVTPGFRVLSMPMAEVTGGTAQPDDHRRLDVDLFVGFRYWNVTDKTGVEVDPASLTVGGAPVTLPGVLSRLRHGHLRLPGEIILHGADKTKQDTTDWYDPIIGARVGVGVTKRWSVFLRGDIGGFDLGSNASNLTWQAMLGSEIRLTDHVSLTSGYRALGVERDGAVANTILHGPQIGALFRF